MKTRTVLLYGSNLLMSIIDASLQKNPEFQVQKIDGLVPDILNKLNAAPPDVILFDLAATHPHFAISLLRNHPTIILIGLDLVINKMLVLSGAHSRFLKADDLVQVIEGGASPIRK